MSSRVQFLIMHFFLFYIIKGITLLNAINSCGPHMESCWVISYSLCSDVDSMLSRWSSWSPGGLLLDSRWILDKKLAGLPPKKKCLNSTWNMWGSVKSSNWTPLTPHGSSGVHLVSWWNPGGLCMAIWLCSPENHLDSGRGHLEYVGQGKVLIKSHPSHQAMCFLPEFFKLRLFYFCHHICHLWFCSITLLPILAYKGRLEHVSM